MARSRNSSHGSLETTEHEKEVSNLAALEGHDADIPSNAGYIADPHAQSLSNPQPTSAKDSDTEKGASAANADDSDPNIVWWDGPDDPANPLNWSAWLKISQVTLISALCFVVPLASSLFAPGVPDVMQDFGSTNVELASFVVSVFILGFAFGPLLLAPASELWGRLWVYHITNVLFVVTTVACALATSMPMLIVFRFLAGCFGAAALSNGGGTIADVISQEKRGGAMAAMTIGPLLGPVVGPIIGGYVSSSKGWRWDFWVIAIIAGAITIICFVLMRETYAPAILGRKARRLQKETGNMQLRSKLDNGLDSKALFMRSIVRPTKLLFFSPIVLLLSIYMGLVYGYLYLLFTTFTFVFEGQYGFSSSSVGLSYLGLGIGNIIGLFVFGFISDKVVKAKAETITLADGTTRSYTKPEWRLPLMVPGAIILPVGLFIYGWTAQYKVHYIVPIFGTLLIGIGNICIFMCTTTYLVDAYTVYAASALAANTVIRSLLGAVLPLAGQSMYDSLGLGWGNSLLGFIALLLLPVPWIFFKYGERIRAGFDSSRL